MANILPGVPVHPGGRFSWKGRVGSTCASELGRVVSARVYPDACDVGFFVQSYRTGARLLFSLVEVQKDSGDEVVAWVYEATDGTRAVVFND